MRKQKTLFRTVNGRMTVAVLLLAYMGVVLIMYYRAPIAFNPLCLSLYFIILILAALPVIAYACATGRKKGIAIIAGAMVCLVAIELIEGPVFSSRVYRNRITVRTEKFSNKTVRQVDFKKTPVVDRESSIKLGDKVMGQMSGLVSQFEVSDEYTQISYKGSVYRVTPLTYPGFIKWANNRSEGIPAYIMVNCTNGKTKLVMLRDLGLSGMKYVPSAWFNDNMQRKLQFRYPTVQFGAPSFEIDDLGHPYYVCSTYSYHALGSYKKVTGVIIFNPITGASRKYEVSNVPKWVDRVYPADLVDEEVNGYGKYQKGFLNSVFTQEGVTKTTSGYNYIENGGDIWYYSGITSANSDDSNLGFVLSNLRTHKTIRIRSPGASEDAAMESAEGEVKNYGYEATFPTLVNVGGKPVYLLSLKDDNGLVKQYAMVDASDYQKVITCSASSLDNLEKLRKDFAGEQNSDTLERRIRIKKLIFLNTGSDSVLYITDTKDRRYKYAVTKDNADTVAFLAEGDRVSISYEKGNIGIIRKLTK